MILPLGSIIKLNNNELTEHNRKALDISYEPYEGSHRMADATLRKYVVTKKRSWSVSWDDVPSVSAKTVDGKWGADDLIAFYEATPGVITLKVRNGDLTEDTFSVVITDFSASISKRGRNYDLYSMSLKLEEV